jgi:hypothetical protein
MGERQRLFERFVRFFTARLTRMGLVVGVWQFRHAAQPACRSVAALCISMIYLMAGVLGIAVHIWQGALDGWRILPMPPREAGAPAASASYLLPEIQPPGVSTNPVRS